MVKEVENEAKIVEKLIINDIQKQLEERKSELAPSPETWVQESNDTEIAEDRSNIIMLPEGTTYQNGYLEKLENDSLEKEVEQWLKE